MPKLIPTADVPQANRLSEVIRVVEAVGKGAKTDKEIGKEIGKVDRQGRYYRLAAEILGLTQRQAKNKSELTSIGKVLFGAGSADRAKYMARAVASTPIIKETLKFLTSKGTRGADEAEIEKFLTGIADLGAKTMAYRRVSSVSRWLVDSGLAIEKPKGRLCASKIKVAAKDPVECVPDKKQLFPEKKSLDDYIPGIKTNTKAKGIIKIMVDEAKRERATAAHEALVTKMADLLKSEGAKPKANQYVDLAAAMGDVTYLFEMKSISDENCVSQVRKGISQLYEYRYLQGLPDAILVLVLEKRIPSREQWLEKYLLEDRLIIPIWVKGEQFVCPDVAKGQLLFLQD